MLLLGVVIIAKGGESGITLNVFNPGETSPRRQRRRRPRRDPDRNPALRRLRGRRLDRRGVQRPEQLDPPRRARHGRRLPASSSHVLRDLSRARPWPSSGHLDRPRPCSTTRDPLRRLLARHDHRPRRHPRRLGLALAICVTIGRGYFALGRDGLLPIVFASTSRHDTPWVGNLMVAVGGIGLIFIFFWRTTGLNQQATVRSAIFGTDAVRHVHHRRDGRLVHGRGGLHDARGRRIRARAACRRTSRGSTPSSLVAVATPILGFYGALKPEPHDRVERSTGRRSTGRSA